MNENIAAKLDIKQLLPEKYAKKRIPRCILRLLERVTAVDKINKLFASAPGKKNMEFVDACMRYLNVTCHVVGEENLPVDGKTKTPKEWANAMKDIVCGLPDTMDNR